MRKSPIFSALDEGSLRQLLRDGLTRRIRAGETIVHPRQPADRFFVILAGRVKIFKLSARGDEQILHFYGVGETFGEAAMWGGGAFPAYAEAVGDAALLIITRRVLHQEIAESPDMAMGMMAGLSAKLREFNQLIEDLSLKEVPARLAGVLLAESKKSGARTVRLQQTKRQLAAQIGTVAETLSRAFKKLRCAGLIEVRGAEITILDADALSEVSENG